VKGFHYQKKNSGFIYTLVVCISCVFSLASFLIRVSSLCGRLANGGVCAYDTRRRQWAQTTRGCRGNRKADYYFHKYCGSHEVLVV